MLLADLPPEIIIAILSFLPISSLGAILRLNKKWLLFIEENQSTIYRDAAHLEGYIPDPTTLLENIGPEESGTEGQALYSRRVTDSLDGWRDFCKRRKFVEHSWAGHAPSFVIPSPRSQNVPLENQRRNNHNYRVHRIKVDEKAGIILTTSQLGGLVVRDLETDEMLWELPVWYVRSYAHLEYGQGYVVFDREGGDKEVWRRAVDIPHDLPVEINPSSLPDELMHSVADHVNILISTRSLTTAHRNAQFTPHALIRMPEASWAYRLVFPTLVVGSFERAFLYDVRTGSQIQTLEGIQTVQPATGHESDVVDSPGEAGPPSQHSGDDDVSLQSDEEQVEEVPDDDNDDNDDDDQDVSQLLGQVRYVEVSERHVFFVGRYVLRVFSRATGKAILDIPSTKTRYGRWRWELASRLIDNDHYGPYDSYEEAQQQKREVVMHPTRFNREEYQTAERLVIDQFVAVHVSSNGKHFVAMLNGSRLVIMHNFEELLMKTSRYGTSGRSARTSPGKSKRDKDRELFEHTLDVQLGAPLASSSVYLAYENGRIGVVTTNSVFIVTPTIPNVEDAIHAPKLTVSRLPYFSNPSWLRAVTCLMMSDTGLYLNWNPAADDDDGEAIKDWDRKFEEELLDYERFENHRYHSLANGDVFVAATPRDFEVSEVSTVYSVKFMMDASRDHRQSVGNADI